MPWRETQQKSMTDPGRRPLRRRHSPVPGLSLWLWRNGARGLGGRGSAGGTGGLFETRNSLTGARRGNRAASRVRLSASARLTAARIAPDRLGRSDVKFHLSDFFFQCCGRSQAIVRRHAALPGRIVVFPVSQKLSLGVLIRFFRSRAHP